MGKRMKLGTRIKLGFWGLIALFLVTVLTANISMIMLNNDMQMLSLNQNKLDVGTRMQKAILNVIGAFREISWDINDGSRSLEEAYITYDDIFAEASKSLTTSDYTALLEKIKESDQVVRPMMNQAIELMRQNKVSEAVTLHNNKIVPLTKQWLSNIEDLQQHSSLSSLETAGDTKQTYERSQILLIGLSIVCLVTGIFLSFFIARIITKPMNSIASWVRESADQVAAASNQLSASAGQLSQGSTEQAAAIMQTSSTIQETSSMVEQNTANTKQAAQLSGHARESADKGNGEMQEMMGTIQEIKKSSDQIAKIIKVIDDIAFQTNILALNAAIEAARAGEAGMGFAVVAEEVRNLAQRSAQAAKDTTEIIESNIELSAKGVSVAEKVRQALQEIVSQSKKVNELMDEISAASQEQAQGIEEVNKSIAQVSVIIQQNAGTAEESAASAEELNAQSENMKQIVLELSELVNGTVSVINENMAETGKPIHLLNHPTRPVKLIQNHKVDSETSKTKVISPEDVIPLEEDVHHF